MNGCFPLGQHLIGWGITARWTAVVNIRMVVVVPSSYPYRRKRAVEPISFNNGFVRIAELRAALRMVRL